MLYCCRIAGPTKANNCPLFLQDVLALEYNAVDRFPFVAQGKVQLLDLPSNEIEWLNAPNPTLRRVRGDDEVRFSPSVPRRN